MPISGVTDIAAARNQLVLYQYDPNVYTHLLMVDSDTVPPAGFIDDLLEVDNPVVSGATLIFKHYEPNRGHPDLRWAIWKRKNQKDGSPVFESVRQIPKNSVLEEPEYVTGAFCLLIQSEVIEQLLAKGGMPLFKTTYNEQTQEKEQSEDIYFCRRVQEDLKLNISIRTDVLCDHWKTLNLTDVAMMLDYQIGCAETGRPRYLWSGMVPEP